MIGINNIEAKKKRKNVISKKCKFTYFDIISLPILLIMLNENQNTDIK